MNQIEYLPLPGGVSVATLSEKEMPMAESIPQLTMLNVAWIGC
jgi:hypothetical protein